MPDKHGRYCFSTSHFVLGGISLQEIMTGWGLTCTSEQSSRAPRLQVGLCSVGLSFASLGLQAVKQALQLLFTEVDFVLQLPLLDDEADFIFTKCSSLR
jgi:hypothetical protein